MSYDPSNPEGITPDRPEAGVPYDRPGLDPYAARPSDAIRSRVQLPGIFLIVTAVVNLLLALVCFGIGFTYSRVPAAQAEQALQNSPWQKQNLEQMKQAGWSMQDALNMYMYGGYAGGIVNIVGGLLILVGGIQMVRLRSYGLAIFSAILAAVPCISCSGCCGLGEGIGIWAIIVLLNPEVRAAFAAIR